MWMACVDAGLEQLHPQARHNGPAQGAGEDQDNDEDEYSATHAEQSEGRHLSGSLGR